MWHDPITFDITLEIASKALLRNVSGPMPATASSVPIEQPTSERERNLLSGMREISIWRRRAHAYDDDMDQPRRDFCEDLEMIENFAKLHLTAYEGKGK